MLYINEELVCSLNATRTEGRADQEDVQFVASGRIQGRSVFDEDVGG